MAVNKLRLTSYNCKHFCSSGDKYTFIDTLMCNTDFLLLQETCLYETAFHKLLSLGSDSDMVGSSAMDESVHRVGRPFGGTAIIWNSSIRGKISKIECKCNRLCGIVYSEGGVTVMILNVYMPYEKYIADYEYIDVMNTMSQLLYKYNPSHVIVGGDMNVDFTRSSPNTRALTDFITDFNLYTCINLPCALVPYTFINYNDSTSRIDHFFVSEYIKDHVSSCNIIDNHLYSDHVPLQLSIDIDIHHVETVERSFDVRKAWYKASEQDIVKYKCRLDELLNEISLCDSVLHCKDIYCTIHREQLCEIYSKVIESCIIASDHIPNTSGGVNKSKPGWNDNVKPLQDEALSWHRHWKCHGRPRDGYIAEMHRITRARYHRAVRHVDKNANTLRAEKMANALLSNNSRDMWSEVRKMKGRNCKIAGSVDNCRDDAGIVGIFSDKYKDLYNSVPYDVNDMSDINCIIMSRLDTCDHAQYIVSANDISNAISHLKSGKSDGSEGLFSDHFINGTHRFYVLLALLYTCILTHGFSPDSMILGTMIPIPKDKKKSLCDSSNYRSIALSSILSKILDWIILTKERTSLISSDLQFGFKEGTSTTQCTFSMMEIIDYYNYNKSDVHVLMLDASKAFDRVNYCRLFKELLNRNMSPLVLRMLLYMYTNQSLRVKWGMSLSSCFTVKNGVKQGGVLSPTLFAVYTDGLLKRLSDTGVGCHMGSRFTGSLAYADDITLLSPSMKGLKLMSTVCEKYAEEYDIIFNGSKSQLLFFQGRCSSSSSLDICVGGKIITASESAIHLGHTVSPHDRERIVKSSKSKFWKSFNIFMSDFGKLSCDIKSKLFSQYCCSYYGSPLWPLSCKSVESLCTDWRKAMRSMWCVSPRTHCNLITALTNQLPLLVSLKKRFVKFIEKCISSSNSIVHIISRIAISNPMSCAGINYRHLLDSYGRLNIDDLFYKWKNTSDLITNDVKTVRELVNIRDGHMNCTGFTTSDIKIILTHVCED